MATITDTVSISGTSSTLKEVLYENLLAILSTDKQIRSNAEQQLKLLETSDEFGLHLIEICLNEAIVSPVRQLSAVLLKQYIECHWTANSDKHVSPIVSPNVKSVIRDILLKSLNSHLGVPNDSIKKLRSSLAYAVSTIAHFDWPEEWPQLGEVLINYLSSGSGTAIYSAMKVFVELSHEVTDTQMPTIAPLLLPKMYQIFVSSQEFSLRTRGRAVQIFTTIAETIAQMGDYDKTAVKVYLEPILPQFTEALVKTLLLPDGNPDVDLGIKKDVINSLTLMLRNCRKIMQKWLPQILEPVWYSMTTAAGVYVKTVVNVQNYDFDNDHESYAEAVDSDGEVLGFESLIFAIFDFVSVVIETPKFRKLVKPVMSELIYYVIIYMQITDEQASAWIDNPDQFVEDEDDDSYSYSIRISALDLILSISQEFEDSESLKSEEFKTCFINAVNRHFAESRDQSKIQNNSSSNWWKIQEACLLALGSLSPAIIETITSNSSLANEFKNILDNIFMNTINVSPFLTGRSLWTASRYAEIMSGDSLNSFLQSTTNGLMAESPVIRIAAARATFVFCDHIKSSNKEPLIKPYLSSMFEGLLSIGTRYNTEVLSLVLETMCILISIDKRFTASIENKVAPLAIATFLKCSQDPLLVAVAQDVFAELCKNEDCIMPLQQRLIPTLVSILQPSEANESVTALQPTSLEILSTIVKNSPLPLSDALIQRAFPAAIACILNTCDDSSTLQNGGECIRTYVAKTAEQVYNYNTESVNGISLVLQVCHHLLDPHINESCSSFVGRLITILITKASQYIGRENSHLLLRAVLVKLHTCETLSVVQSLVLVFSHLIYYDLTAILDFLSSLPAPTGTQSALEFVLINWLNRQHLFFGSYESKVSILALCKLLQHSIVNCSQDSQLNLNRINVPGDAIVSDSPGIKTRSKSASNPVQWSSVPCSVKILKLLLAELRTFEENREIQTVDSDDEDDDEEDGNGSTHSDSIINGIPVASLDTSLTGIIDESWAEGEGDLNEEDILNEDIGKINIEEYLTNVLREFKSLPFLNDFALQLTDGEKIFFNKI